VVAYPSAEEAAAAFADRSLDLALIDIRLPGRPGDAYAADLHAHQPDLPIIFFTAESKTEHLTELIPNSRVCQKPVSPSALLKVIESTCPISQRHHHG
jgi:DNA-binding NarL/FixJ family response regulator